MANGNTTKSLYDFMSQLNRDNVRSNNLFEMRVFIPAELRGGNYPGGTMLTRYLNPNFTFYGKGFELPNRQISYQEVGFKGFKVPVPTVMQMGQEHTVTINADIEGNMRRAFMAWQALTINPQIDNNGGYFEGNRLLQNTAKIYIDLLDPTYKTIDRIVESYTLFGVTIQEVGTMSFSNEEANIATFNIIFKSQYWQYGHDNDYRTSISTSASSGVPNNGNKVAVNIK